VALLFEKPSARTRNSTEMAVDGLGGHPVYIQGTEVGLDTRESAEDVARTLGCYHRILCARVFDHAVLRRMAFGPRHQQLRRTGRSTSSPTKPTPARPSPMSSPCATSLGSLAGLSLAYIGDANNMCRSLAKAALMEGMEFRVASPAAYSFSAEELAGLQAFSGRIGRGGTVRATNDPEDAAGDADALYTDVWTSMGQEEERAARLEAFTGFTIDDALLDVAEPDVAVLHCLPAHRGEEISASVFEGPHSVVWRRPPTGDGHAGHPGLGPVHRAPVGSAGS
jgi:ornithine carbamoyltransferase